MREDKRDTRMIQRARISKEDEAALAAAMSTTHASFADQEDYSAVVIEKPWGYEYSLMKSDASDAWFLSIQQGQRTSMHCHPTKKTSIVLLGGECEVTTFNKKAILKAGDGIVIDKGVFHSTLALSPSGISLLETETPVNKKDLVRFNDVYGRVGLSYEGGKHVRPRDPMAMPSFYEAEGRDRQMVFSECRLSAHVLHDAVQFTRALSSFSDGVMVVLGGEVRDGSGAVLFSHADAFHAHELTAHAGALSLTGNLQLLYVQKIV